LGGETKRRRFTLHSLELAGRRFTDVPAAIDEQDNSSDLNVGISILRRFHVTTDYAEHAVWLAP
jgi:predicted aspartyl protease